MQRSWLSTLAWIAWGLLAAFGALLAATNPSRADLVDSVRLLTSKGLGKFAGNSLTDNFAVCLECNTKLTGNSLTMFLLCTELHLQGVG